MNGENYNFYFNPKATSALKQAPMPCFLNQFDTNLSEM